MTCVRLYDRAGVVEHVYGVFIVCVLYATMQWLLFPLGLVIFWALWAIPMLDTASEHPKYSIRRAVPAVPAAAVPAAVEAVPAAVGAVPAVPAAVEAAEPEKVENETKSQDAPTHEAKPIERGHIDVDEYDTNWQVVNTTNILWSRNWHNLVTCSTVPESYYNAATEKRHSTHEMMKYFSGCGGFVWVRLNTDHRNAKNNDITTFATHVLPKMKKAFVLITTDGDNSVPSNIDKAQDILANPLCMGWYTQNYDGSLKHSKLKPIPIGFDLHTNWKGLWTDNVSENLEKMLELRANSLERTRDAVPFVPPWGANHRERIRSDHALECLHHVHGNRMGIDKLWDTYGSKTFALSPQGNGLDCHRTWELLFFGVIPIVKSVGGLDAVYKDLPVVIVKDWTDVCASNFFVNERERLKDKWPMSLDKFQLDYWVPPVNFMLTQNVDSPKASVPEKVTTSLNEINIDIDATACRDFHRVGDTGDGGW